MASNSIVNTDLLTGDPVRSQLNLRMSPWLVRLGIRCRMLTLFDARLWKTLRVQEMDTSPSRQTMTALLADTGRHRIQRMFPKFGIHPKSFRNGINDVLRPLGQYTKNARPIN